MLHFNDLSTLKKQVVNNPPTNILKYPMTQKLAVNPNSQIY